MLILDELEDNGKTMNTVRTHVIEKLGVPGGPGQNTLPGAAAKRKSPGGGRGTGPKLPSQSSSA